MLKLGVLALAVAGVGFVGQAQAAPVTINFDELANGEILTNQYAALGVKFSSNSGDLIVRRTYPGPVFTPPNVVKPYAYWTVGSYSQASFSLPVDAVSVTLGDWDGDADALYLEIFDAGLHSLGLTSAFLPAKVAGGFNLSLSHTGIAYARFWGVGDRQNSAYFDNFSFNTVDAPSAPVPEPFTLTLFGTGLVGLALRHRRARR